MTSEDEVPSDVQKVQKILLQLNKTGLSYLKYLQFNDAIGFFKKAERIVEEQLIINSKNQRINQLAGVTYNNLACYYKKTKLPKVALGYLKRSLELQIFQINDWVATGSTHLNICAIYSYLGKHQEAINHVNLSLELLEKKEYSREDASEEAKSYWNIKMLCFYNKAIEEEHLNLYEQSLNSYQTAKQIAKSQGSKNARIAINCDEGIARIETVLSNLRKKMMSQLIKKKQEKQTSHYDFIRYHKPFPIKSDSKDRLTNSKKFLMQKSSSAKNRGERRTFFSKHKEGKEGKQKDMKDIQTPGLIQMIQRKTTFARFKSLSEYLNYKNKTEPAELSD